MPKYDELSVANVMEALKGDEHLMKFMPDKLSKGKVPDQICLVENVFI